MLISTEYDVALDDFDAVELCYNYNLRLCGYLRPIMRLNIIDKLHNENTRIRYDYSDSNDLYESI